MIGLDVKIKNKVDTKKVKSRLAKAKGASLADATRYVWKTARNSVQRGTSFKAEKIPLRYYDADGRFLFEGKPTTDWKSKSLARKDRLLKNLAKHVRGQKFRGKGAKSKRAAKKAKLENIKRLRQGVRDEKLYRKKHAGYLRDVVGGRKNDYTFTVNNPRPSAPGQVPRSWDHWSPYMNYYLKERILFDSYMGVVYVSPGKSTADIWFRHEYGGTFPTMISYPVAIVDRKKGLHWEQQKKVRQVRYPKRPIMEPAKQKSAKHIPKIYADRIRTAFY